MSYRSVCSDLLFAPESMVKGELFRVPDYNTSIGLTNSTSVTSTATLLTEMKAGKNVFYCTTSSIVLPSLDNLVKIYTGVQNLTAIPLTFVNTSTGGTLTITAGGTGGDSTAKVIAVAPASTR